MTPEHEQDLESRLDWIIQTVADARTDYANTAATLAENYLSLLLQAAYETADSLQQVQTALFER